MTTMVTGGAGFIGSHMVRALLRRGRRAVVIDDLSTGHADAVPADVPLVVADMADESAMKRVFADHEIDEIVHFAARTQVGESMIDPRRYWNGNVVATAALLERALDAGVERIIFSSTAAVYGAPARIPIEEDDAALPINPYGETKLAVERMLAAYSRAYGLRYCALRYFNAAGADPDGGLAERHDPETHLIPLVLDAAIGRRRHVAIFGRDHDTPDGTCVRDYIHVLDLVEAHLAALDHLATGGASGVLNLGTGAGHSVAEVVETCRRVTGREIPVTLAPPRAGDPPALVASPRRAEQTLGWRAARSDLARIVEDAWRVHQLPGKSSSARRATVHEKEEPPHAH